MLSTGSNALGAASKSSQSLSGEIVGPDLARLNNRFAAILNEAACNRNRINDALDRLGRPQPEQDETTCCPARAGAVGYYEDRLDELGAFGEQLRIIANVLEQIV